MKNFKVGEKVLITLNDEAYQSVVSDRSIRETSQEITTHFSFDLGQTGWSILLSRTLKKVEEK